MKSLAFTYKLLLSFLCITLYANPNIARDSDPNDSIVSKQSKKAKNIILLIGDGMGLSQIYSGIVANGSLNIEKFKNIGFQKTYSAFDFITDSGAGGTAISTGTKTRNGAIAVDTAGKPIKTILEIAEQKGLSTGLVSTSAITHATPASFIAHNINRNNYEQIAEDFLKTGIDVFIGGGKNHFNKRKDSIDLCIKLIQKGYIVTDTITDIIGINNGKLAGFTAKGHNPSILDGRGEMLSLATKTAINILDNNAKGFFLMVEGSQIDWGGHDNDTRRIAYEMIDFDKAIGIALDFARKNGNTLVIVTADHETGGMTLNSGNIKEKTFEAVYTTKDHTGIMVPVFAFGPGSEKFNGIYQNTAIFYKMLESLKIK